MGIYLRAGNSYKLETNTVANRTYYSVYTGQRRILIPHPIIFESLDASVVRSAALRVTGAAGPSGLDAHEWRRLSTSHEGASKDLCASLATVSRRICSSYVDPTSIKPLLGILMRVVSLLSTNTHECVTLALVTLPFESLPKLFYPLQPLRSRSRCCTCPERKVLEVAVKATCVST